MRLSLPSHLRARRRSRGQSLVELALVASVFLLLMLTAIWIAQPTELGLSAYLATNLTVGTLGHAGVRLVGTAERTSPWLAWLDTSLFHTRHHTERECNYGFYTPIWDRLFGTLRK